MSRALTVVQFGPESNAGTGVAATFKWPGEAEIDFDDKIILPKYMTGNGTRNVEDAFVSQTGTTLTLKDTPMSAELLAYILQSGVKKISGSASNFPFTFPSAATANTIGTYTWEFAVAGQATQEYEFAYGYLESFSIAGDNDANDGQVMFNGVVKGRKAAANTVTGGLSLIANRVPLNMPGATIKIDAVGTAAGNAAATTGFLKAFSMDVSGLWGSGFYSDGRTDLDFSLPEGGVEYKITGNIKCLLNSVALTEIVNARAGTGRIVQIAFSGASSRSVKLNLPLNWTKAPKIGDQVTSTGLFLVSFPYDASYSSTATAQAPAIDVTLSGALTVFS